MTFHAPVTKPYGVAPSPYMAQGAAKGLWKGLAFIAPLQTPKGAGTSTLLDQFGHPLAGSNLTAGSTLQWRGTPYGLGVGISGASELLLQTSFAPIITSDGAGTGDFTMICLANPKAEARASIALGQRVSGGTNDWAYLFFNGAETGGNVSGRFSFSTYSSAVTHASILNVIDGQTRLWGGVRSGTQLTAYIDGVPRATATGTVRDIVGATSAFGIGQNVDGTGFRIATDCTIGLVAGWNRALSKFEMLLLGIDPFYMFRPAPRQKIINTVAAGGTAVPVFMHHYMQQRAA